MNRGPALLLRSGPRRVKRRFLEILFQIRAGDSDGPEEANTNRGMFPGNRMRERHELRRYPWNAPANRVTRCLCGEL